MASYSRPDISQISMLILLGRMGWSEDVYWRRRFAAHTAHLHTIKARGWASWLRVKRDLIMHALCCADARNEVVSSSIKTQEGASWWVLLRAGRFWPTRAEGEEAIPIPGAMFSHFIRSKRRRPCIKRREFLEYLDPGLRKVILRCLRARGLHALSQLSSAAAAASTDVCLRRRAILDELSGTNNHHVEKIQEKQRGTLFLACPDPDLSLRVRAASPKQPQQPRSPAVIQCSSERAEDPSTQSVTDPQSRVRTGVKRVRLVPVSSERPTSWGTLASRWAGRAQDEG